MLEEDATEKGSFIGRLHLKYIRRLGLISHGYYLGDLGAIQNEFVFYNLRFVPHIYMRYNLQVTLKPESQNLLI